MLNCVYHLTEPMRVVNDEDKAKLIATGEWFDHPNKVKELKYHEEQIRQHARKRRSDGENTPK